MLTLSILTYRILCIVFSRRMCDSMSFINVHAMRSASPPQQLFDGIINYLLSLHSVCIWLSERTREKMSLMSHPLCSKNREQRKRDMTVVVRTLQIHKSLRWEPSDRRRWRHRTLRGETVVVVFATMVPKMRCVCCMYRFRNRNDHYTDTVRLYRAANSHDRHVKSLFRVRERERKREKNPNERRRCCSSRHYPPGDTTLPFRAPTICVRSFFVYCIYLRTWSLLNPLVLGVLGVFTSNLPPSWSWCGP
jgi:hypothetical protein